MLLSVCCRFYHRFAPGRRYELRIQLGYFVLASLKKFLACVTAGRTRQHSNMGHIIRLGGKKLLHVGDADTSIENFEKFNLDEEQIDIAFLPDWSREDNAKDES